MAEIKDKLWLESLCRSFTEHSVKVLGGWVVGEQTDPELKLRAINTLLDRGWGKPAQDNSHSHEVKGEIKVILRQMLEDDDE